MPVQSVQDVALSQIPDLDCGIIGCRQQVSAIRVEGDLVNSFLVGIVVLE
jgi:hypothetical protein